MTAHKNELEEEARAELELQALPRTASKILRWRHFRAIAFAAPVLVIAFAALWVYASGGRWVQTDNAYIKADKAQISARVSGPVSAVLVQTNQQVSAGDLLFTIDDKDYAAALAAARAARDEAIGLIRSGQASYWQKRKQRDLARNNLAFAARELKRREKLVAAKVVSAATLDDYRHRRDVAADALAVREEELKVLLAQLGDPEAPAEHHPHVRAANARVDAAELDLQHTRVHAPISGIAAHVPVLGDFVSPGQPVMAVVASEGMWVEANFKETQLTHVRPGQSASLHVDSYPGRAFDGDVRSINPASGAEFALLPPQNASGNWVKVVQRIPVRLAIEVPKDAPPLRAGMSVRVRIDTGHHRALPGFIRAPLRWLGADVG